MLLPGRALLLACLLASAIGAEVGPPPAHVRIETGDPLSMVAPGREGDLAIVVSNPADHPVKLRLTAQLSEFDGPALPLVRDLELAVGGEARLPVPLGAKRTGIRYLDYSLVGDGLAEEKGQSSFFYGTAAPAGPDPAGFTYAVTSHPGRSQNSDAMRELEMIATSRAGLSAMRIDAMWGALESVPEQWQWKDFDRLVELGARHQVAMQVILDFCVGHAAGPSPQAAYTEAKKRGDAMAMKILMFAAPMEAPWRRFVATITARYKGRIKLWEVWNEPDLAGFWNASIDEYIRILRSAAEEIRRTDPENVVLSGGFATVLEHGGRSLNPEMQARVLAEASDAFDAHAYHGHGPFSPFRVSVEGELARLRARMKVTRPLYFSETALTSGHNGELVQAAALVKKLAFARSVGAIGYTWYSLRNDGWDRNDDELNYGMLQMDFRPKAVFAACIELTRRMRGTRYLGELKLGPGRFGYVFAGEGRRLAVLWNEDPGLGDEPFALAVPMLTTATAVDLMGNPTPLPVRGGVVMARLGSVPMYLELPGGEAMPTVAGALLALPVEVLASPGERISFPLRLRNPLAEPIKLDLAWDEQGRSETRTIELLGGCGGEAWVSTTCPSTASWNAPAVLALRFAVQGGPWSGSVNVPIRTVQCIPAAAPEARAPDFAIETHAAVVNFFEADPAQQHNTWQGAVDCSARIWLWRGDGNLRLRVAVCDNRHHQPGPAADSWKGDGLQFAFVVPGQNGFWEVGAARAADGTLLRHIWRYPQGCTADPGAVGAVTTPISGGMLYDVSLPYAGFGLSDQVLERGMRFNLIVNDNDGEGRKGFMRIAPGIGESKDPYPYPVVRFVR